MKITKRELIEAVELAWNVAECADISCGPMVYGTKVGDDGIEYTIINAPRVALFQQLLAYVCPRLPTEHHSGVAVEEPTLKR